MSLQTILDTVQQEITAAENFISIEIPKIKALGNYLDALKPELDILLTINPSLKTKFDELVVVIDHLIGQLPTKQD